VIAKVSASVGYANANPAAKPTWTRTGEQPEVYPPQEVLDKLYISSTPPRRSCADDPVLEQSEVQQMNLHPGTRPVLLRRSARASRPIRPDGDLTPMSA
jgi:hypothetical protein